MRPFQGDFERVSEQYSLNGNNFLGHYRGSCCAYNTWEECIVDELSGECGPRAGAIFRTFIRHIVFHVFRSFCPSELYNPADVRQCPPQLYRSPPSYVPKGVKSTNSMSYFFALVCPNAAYGIDPKDKNYLK